MGLGIPVQFDIGWASQVLTHSGAARPWLVEFLPLIPSTGRLAVHAFFGCAVAAFALNSTATA